MLKKIGCIFNHRPNLIKDMKQISFFAMAALFINVASAQIQWGAKAGLDFSNSHESSPVSKNVYNNKPGFNAGGLAYIALSNHFGLQPEIMYLSQGSKEKVITETITGNVQYVDVPVLFKYKNTAGFFIEAGPQIDFLLQAKSYSYGLYTNEKQYYKSPNLSGVAGIGYLSRLNIGVDVRYSLGLTRTNQTITIDGTSYYPDNKIRDNVFQADLFYVFGKTKK